MGWLTTLDTVPEIDLQKLEAKALRDSRPDLSRLTDAQLLARARTIQRHLRAMFSQVVWASMGSGIGPGILAPMIGESDPAAVTKLMTGIGDVDSADIAAQIFNISRIVRDSPELMAEFDGDLDGLLDRVAKMDTPAAMRFLAAVDGFMYEHGSRGPNEWDIYAWGYETRPTLLWQAIERARGADEESNPVATVARGAAERNRVIARYEEAFSGNDDALAAFHIAVKAIEVFMAARERCKSSNIRAHGEVRMCFGELGRRMTERGHLAHGRQIYMLLSSELDAFMVDPGSLVTTLERREQDYLALYDLEPPYIVDGTVRPLGEWARRNSTEVELVAVGDVLQGVAGSPGHVTGTARILLDLNDPSRLEPGDILIAPSTDPSWTPLFLAAGGVITNIGAIGTHAVIVSRELGIPCVPSIPEATRRIPDGATITLDGSIGTVTIDALP